MKKKIWLCLVVLSCLLFCPAIVQASPATDYLFWQDVSKQFAQESWKLLGGKAQETIVLTNAGYVMAGSHATQGLLDGLSKETGSTVGKGNLLEVHAARTAPLWVALYDKKSGKAVYSSLNKDKCQELLTAEKKNLKGIKKEEIFKKTVCENIRLDYLSANGQEWDKKMGEKVFDGNEFRIISIVNAVAKGAPQDLVKGVLYHDHFCPGVTSGYLLANFLEKEMPLCSSAQSYFIISVPVWCKEDAIQTVLNATPGKSGMAILPLNDKQKEKLLPEAKNLAGIYFRTDAKSKKTEALVLGFDFAQGEKLSGLGEQKMFGWEKKFRTVSWELDNLDKPELFVKVLKRFELKDGEQPQDYVQPGVNVLIKLGLAK